MSLPEFKCRASATGMIMTNDRSGKKLGQTCINVIEDWARYNLYGVRKEFSSKQISKGLLMEDQAIDYAAAYFGWGDVKKNESYLENDYFTGTYDLKVEKKGEIIVDIKNSWDPYTFPLFAEDIKNLAYRNQLQTYCNLDGARKAMLVYCLMTAPDHIIESEAWKQSRAAGLSELTEELYQKVKAHMTYDHLPPELRIKSYGILYDPLLVAQIQTRVIDCREYVTDFIEPKINSLGKTQLI